VATLKILILVGNETVIADKITYGVVFNATECHVQSIHGSRKRLDSLHHEVKNYKMNAVPIMNLTKAPISCILF
jgi:hypothetical protein